MFFNARAGSLLSSSSYFNRMIRSSFANPPRMPLVACRSPSSGPIASRPPGFDARKTCLDHAVCRISCPSPSERDFVHKFRSPCLCLASLDCVLVCGCHKQPFETNSLQPHLPTWRLALCPIPALSLIRTCTVPCYFFISTP